VRYILYRLNKEGKRILCQLNFTSVTAFFNLPIDGFKKRPRACALTALLKK